MKASTIIFAAISMLTITANANTITCRGVNSDNGQNVVAVVEERLVSVHNLEAPDELKAKGENGTELKEYHTTLSLNGADQGELGQINSAEAFGGTWNLIGKSAVIIVSKNTLRGTISAKGMDQVSLKCDLKD